MYICIYIYNNGSTSPSPHGVLVERPHRNFQPRSHRRTYIYIYICIYIYIYTYIYIHIYIYNNGSTSPSPHGMLVERPHRNFQPRSHRRTRSNVTFCHTACTHTASTTSTAATPGGGGCGGWHEVWEVRREGVGEGVQLCAEGDGGGESEGGGEQLELHLFKGNRRGG